MSPVRDDNKQTASATNLVLLGQIYRATRNTLKPQSKHDGANRSKMGIKTKCHLIKPTGLHGFVRPSMWFMTQSCLPINNLHVSCSSPRWPKAEIGLWTRGWLLIKDACGLLLLLLHRNHMLLICCACQMQTNKWSWINHSDWERTEKPQTNQSILENVIKGHNAPMYHYVHVKQAKKF